MKRATALIEFPLATGFEKKITDKYQGTKKTLTPARFEPTTSGSDHLSITSFSRPVAGGNSIRGMLSSPHSLIHFKISRFIT